MRTTVQLLKFVFVLMIFSGSIFSCKKTDTPSEEPVDPPPPKDSTHANINADTISNHLRFSNAAKINGPIPKGPAGSSLKISFKDTLYLVDKWKVPVEFLHEDTTKNVAGVYVQIRVGLSGGTFYYDVPEVTDIATNDTVSMILIGIEPKGLIDTTGVQPAGSPAFEITIVPHDPKGLPLGEITRPVQISIPSTDPKGGCGLVTKPGEAWTWSMSFIADPLNPLGEDIFFNAPHKLWDLIGQRIQGCCTDGVSAYTPNCLDRNKKSLIFQTFFGWPNELYKFFEDGTYAGLSEFISADPDPQVSNFCGVAPGVVKEDFDRYFLEGTWAIKSSSFLSTLGSSTPAGGTRAARPDGRIDLVSCRLLIIIQSDGEGGNRDLVKFYTRRDSNSPFWSPFT